MSHVRRRKNAERPNVRVDTATRLQHERPALTRCNDVTHLTVLTWRSGSGAILRDQVVDVPAVGLGERRAFDEQNILGVELGAAREVVGAGDHGVVDHENFVVHEIVDAVGV